LHFITISLYLFLNKNIFFKISYAIIIFILIEHLFCNVFGFYAGP
jgi:hypothetical protein